MKRPKRSLVYYSLLLKKSNYSKLLKQHLKSVTSLRHFNSSVPVYLMVWGKRITVRDLLKLKKLNVEVHHLGSYEKALGKYYSPAWAKAMSKFPLMQKLLSLPFTLQKDFDSILYLDNDTYCFRDVEDMIQNNQSADFYAREEPFSKKSYLGYDKSYVDEEALTAVTRSENVGFITPFNAGVMLIKRKAAETLVRNLDLFFHFLIRMTLWICQDPNGLGSTYSHIAYAKKMKLHLHSSHIKPLAYPSGNPWITEEIAMWLTLGTSPIKIKIFKFDQLLQANEYTVIRLARHRPYILHYYSTNEAHFSSKWLPQFKAKFPSAFKGRHRHQNGALLP